MREDHTPHRRALAVLLTATALVATPALAQDAAPAAPSPVQAAPAPAPVQAAPAPQAPPAAPVIAAPAPVAQAPAPAQSAAAAPAQSAPGADAQSATPVNPEAAAQAAAEDQERRAAARPAPKREARAIAPRQAAPARAAAAPPPAPAATKPAATAPAPTTPAPAAEAPAAAPAQPAATADSSATSTTTASTETPSASTPVWPWVALGLVVIAALGAFVAWRRRRAEAEAETYWAEPVEEVAAEPVYVAEPMTAAPVAAAPVAAMPVLETPIVETAVADDAVVTDADAEDVAALTAAEPVQERPWLELAMRPLRAGTSAEEAMVEIELTIGNAGAVRADDVRVSTFLLAQADDGEMERLLARPAPTAVEPLDIEPGEGARIDATLAVPRGGVNGSFQPVVVADARYRLPDGSEGRTSASFVIGRTSDGDALPAIDTHGDMLNDDVEARLYGPVEHA